MPALEIFVGVWAVWKLLCAFTLLQVAIIDLFRLGGHNLCLIHKRAGAIVGLIPVRG